MVIAKTIHKFRQIEDLFNKRFIVDFAEFLINTSRTSIINNYKCYRKTYLNNLTVDSKDTNGNIITYAKFNIKDFYPIKNIECSLPLKFEDYERNLYQDFSLRFLLYQHYGFCIKKNKKFIVKYIVPIVKYFFSYDIRTYLKSKTDIWGNNFQDNEIIYLVLDDIFISLSLIDKIIINKLKLENNIIHYVCKSVLQEKIDSNPIVENMLKPKVTRSNNDIDNSNKAIYGYYKSYINYLEIIKDEVGIEDFIESDRDERLFIMQNLELDDVYFTSYMDSISKEELLKPNKTIAYNILAYQYPNLSKDSIRQSCSRASKIELIKLSPNILQKADEKISNFMDLKPSEKHEITIKANNLIKCIDKLH